MEVWATARYDLAIPEDEIGRLNMIEFDALCRRKEAEDQRARLNAGFVWAAVLNSAAFGDPDRKPARPTDIVPGLQEKEEVPDLTTMTAEEQVAYVKRAFMGAGNRSMR